MRAPDVPTQLTSAGPSLLPRTCSIGSDTAHSGPACIGTAPGLSAPPLRAATIPGQTQEEPHSTLDVLANAVSLGPGTTGMTSAGYDTNANPKPDPCPEFSTLVPTPVLALTPTLTLKLTLTLTLTRSNPNPNLRSD